MTEQNPNPITTPAAETPQPKKRSTVKILAIVGGVLILLCIVCAVGVSLLPDAEETATPISQVTQPEADEPTTVPTEPTEPTEPPLPTDTAVPTNTSMPTDTPLPSLTPTLESPESPKGDGFHTVGEEIALGKWRSTGSGSSCYWARLDENQDINDNHLGMTGGTVTIREEDYEVEFSDCGTFVYVEGVEQELQPDAAEPKGDGFYTVGVDIVPGKWESTGTGDMCYWARLDDKQNINDNHLGNAGGTVTIRDNDYEVLFEDCGTFVYVEGVEQELQPDAAEPKGDGFYTVGVDIVPGKWESTGTGDMCYWARLDDKQNINDNHLGNAGGTINIRGNDYEILFNDCGIWEYKGE